MGAALSYSKVYLAHIVIFVSMIFYILRIKEIKVVIINLWPFIVITLWLALSVLWSENVESSIKYLMQFGTGFIGFCLICSLSNGLNYKVVRILLLLYSSHHFVSLLEAFTAFRLPISPMSKYLGHFRFGNLLINNSSYPGSYLSYPTSFFWHPNYAAIITLCGLPFVLNSSLKFGIKFIFWVSSLIIIIKCGAKAILVFLGVYSFYFLTRNLRSIDKKILFSLGFLIPLLLIVTIKSLNSSQRQEFNESIMTVSHYGKSLPLIAQSFFTEKVDTSKLDGNTSERFRFMLGAIQEYKKSPILGVGAGQLYDKVVKVNNKNTNLSSIHNHWLEMFVIGGPIVLLTYLFWYFRSTWLLFENNDWMSKALRQAMILFFFTVPVLSSSHYFLPMWLLYSLVSIHLSTTKDPGINQ
jgi:hypothetical protein